MFKYIYLEVSFRTEQFDIENNVVLIFVWIIHSFLEHFSGKPKNTRVDITTGKYAFSKWLRTFISDFLILDSAIIRPFQVEDATKQCVVSK